MCRAWRREKNTSESTDYLQKMNIDALDALYADLLRLARRGTPGAKERLREIVQLRARLSHGSYDLQAHLREIDELNRRN